MSGPIKPDYVTNIVRQVDLIIFDAVNYLIRSTWDGKMAFVSKEAVCSAANYRRRGGLAMSIIGDWGPTLKMYQDVGWVVRENDVFVEFFKREKS